MDSGYFILVKEKDLLTVPVLMKYVGHSSLMAIT